MGLFDFFRKGNDFSDDDKAKLDGIDPSKYVSIDQYNELRNQITQLIEFMPEHVDTSKFLTEDDLPDLTVYAKADQIPQPIDLSQFITLKDSSVYALAKDIPKLPDTSKFALKTDVPSLSGYAKLTDIPKLPDISVYALKKDIPDTVKYIENSNPTSKIKKIRLSIEDKATFKPDSNPADNIAHTI